MAFLVWTPQPLIQVVKLVRGERRNNGSDTAVQQEDYLG
jgi:hypothetical protein